ncbi:MAG: hypothetical protein ACI83W_001629 [Marinoscillum sp.]|jgi:hypothetical protein
MKSISASVFLFVSLVTAAQSQVDKFLSSEITDTEYIIQKLSADYINEHNFASPWLRELDFRVRTGDQETPIDEYRARLGLINPFEIKANSDYAKLLSSQNAFNREAVINDVLLGRYELILENYYLSEMSRLITERIRTFRYLEEISLTGKVKLDNLIDMEATKTKLLLRQIELGKKKVFVDKSIQTKTGNAISWEQFNWVATEVLIQYCYDLVEAPYLATIANEQKLELKRQEFKIDKAEAFSNIGFIQGEYDVTRGNAFNEHLGFQIGVQIPLFNQDKPSLQRKELDMISAEVKAKTVSDEEDWEYDKLLSDIESAKQSLEVLINQQVKLSDYKNLAATVKGEVDIIESLNDYDFFLSEKFLATVCLIRTKCIQVIHQKGKLFDANGAINHLSEEAALLEISK